MSNPATPAAPPPSNGGVSGDQNTWYIVAFFVTAIATLFVGYIAGSTSESGSAEKTLEAKSSESTQAVSNLATQLSLSEVQSFNALATQELEIQALLATRDAQSTAAIRAVTQAVADSQATQDAIINAYTATPSPTHTHSPSETPVIPQGIILPISSTLYFGPGPDYPFVAQVLQDTPVQILSLSPDGAWLEITYTDASNDIIRGYVPIEAVRHTGGSRQGIAVAHNFPSLTPSPTQTLEPTPTAIIPTATPSQPEAQLAILASSVYSGPDEAYPIVGIVLQGTPVQILSISADAQWLQITYEGGEGFIRANALQLTGGSLAILPIADAPPLPTSTPAPLVSTPSAPEASAAGQFVVVREGPNDAFNVLGVASAQEVLSITAISTDGLWFQVDFAHSPDGKGWVSGQVINVGGNLSNLPVVQGPQLPTISTDNNPTSPDTLGSDTPSSAGSLGPLDLVSLPDTLQIDYSALLDAYAYEVTIAVNGLADGADYQTFTQFTYAQNASASQINVTMDADGAFLATFIGDDLDALSSFLPFTLGEIDNQGYIYLQTDDVCFSAGEELDAQSFDALLLDIFKEETLDLFHNLTDDNDFVIVDENGLAGIAGRHYQYVGAVADEVKIDLWWSESANIAYGYRLTLVITPENYFLYQQTLAQFDTSFQQLDSFEGFMTLYILPTGINESAEALSLPPTACNTALGLD